MIKAVKVLKENKVHGSIAHGELMQSKSLSLRLNNA